MIFKQLPQNLCLNFNYMLCLIQQTFLLNLVKIHQLLSDFLAILLVIFLLVKHGFCKERFILFFFLNNLK